MSTKTQGISLEIIDGPNYEQDADGWEHHAYTLRLSYQGRTMDTPWRAGLLITDDPAVGDVLENMALDAFSADSSFEDWAANYGYDTDSRKTERLYHAVVAQTAALRKLLGSDFDAIIADATDA